MMKIPIFLLFLALLSGQAQSKDNLDEAIRIYGKGAYRQAVVLLQQEAKSSPKDAEVRFWLGKSYLKIRDWGSAIKEMEKAVELQPSNPRYHLYLGRACGERASRVFFTTAFSLARRVIKEFQTASNLAPKDPGIRFDLLEYYLQAPGIVGGGKDKAEAEARMIANLSPVKGYIARATIYRNEKKWDMAKSELTQATMDYPKDADAFKDLADYLLDRQDYAGAFDYGKKALALNGQSKRSKFIVAVAETKLQKDLDQASKTLQELVAGSLQDGDPSFEEAHYWLGENHLLRGDKESARSAFMTALTFNPEYSRAKDELSRIK